MAIQKRKQGPTKKTDEKTVKFFNNTVATLKSLSPEFLTQAIDTIARTPLTPEAKEHIATKAQEIEDSEKYVLPKAWENLTTLNLSLHTKEDM